MCGQGTFRKPDGSDIDVFFGDSSSAFGPFVYRKGEYLQHSIWVPFDPASVPDVQVVRAAIAEQLDGLSRDDILDGLAYMVMHSGEA